MVMKKLEREQVVIREWDIEFYRQEVFLIMIKFKIDVYILVDKGEGKVFRVKDCEGWSIGWLFFLGRKESKLNKILEENGKINQKFNKK